MNARIKQLRDLVVGLDRVDRNLDEVDAEAYRIAAGKALRLTQEEMGLLPIGLSFVGPAWSEAKLLAYGQAFERATTHRRPPGFIARTTPM